jgi:hypothetical protein
MSAQDLIGLVGGGVARAVIAHGQDLVAALLLIALGHLGEDVALDIGEQMVGPAECEGVVGHADRRVGAGCEAGAGDDDVDGAQRQALVDVGFLAELRGRIDRDLVAAIGALLDLVGGPDGLGVEGLGGLIDMGPFQDRFSLRGQGRGQDRSRCSQ